MIMAAPTDIFDELKSSFQNSLNLLGKLNADGPNEGLYAELENSILDSWNLVKRVNALHPNSKHYTHLGNQLSKMLQTASELREKSTHA